MAFNISTLPNYVDQTSKTLLVDTVFGSQTADVLKGAESSVTLGVKGTVALQLMSTDIALQTNTGCGRNPVGDTTFAQAYISVVPLKDEQNFCPKPLENKWTVQYLTKGQTYTEALFANEIMAARAAKIAEANEQLMWKGDTVAQSGNTALNKFDGFIKQLATGSISLSGATGATVVEKLQNAFIGMPTKVTAQSDVVMFIGTDVFNEYNVALANKNIFKSTDDKILFGTTIKLVPVDGLNGTRKVYVGRLRSFQMATDLMGEEDKATMNYSIETQNIYMDFHWALGVKAIYVSEVGVATV
ncbi:MAG: hypothetical protein V4520_02445 [Bacteroidota bacterium]